jgi:hypothetical protein
LVVVEVAKLLETKHASILASARNEHRPPIKRKGETP